MPSWVVLCEATRLDAAEGARELIDGGAFADMSVDVRADGAVYALEICQLSPINRV